MRGLGQQVQELLMSTLHSRLRLKLATALLVGAAATAAGSMASIAAEPASLEGAWRGSGNVRFATGETERATCRASFRKRGVNGFVMTATCATPSAKATQTAELTRSGSNRFSGSFENTEFGVSGSITVTVNGNSLSASLIGGGATAVMSLNR